MTDRWDKHFLNLAIENAKMSKDPNTRVGAAIVGPEREVRSMGFNGLPRGVVDTDYRLNNRDVKLSMIVHGEMNAVLNAARIGVSTKGCTLYLAAVDSNGKVWGGAPCLRCAVELIQAGIVEIVAPPMKIGDSNWRWSIEQSKDILFEAGVQLREVEI